MRGRPTTPFASAAALFVSMVTIQPQRLGAQERSTLDSTTAYVTTLSALRSAPSDTAGTPTSILAGTGVHVVRCADGWCRIEFWNLVGYLRQEVLTTTAPPNAPQTTQLVPTPLRPQITKTYDRIDDYTSTDLEPMPVSTFQLGAFYTCHGHSVCVPKFITLHISSSSGDWQYLESSHLRFLLDGRTRIDIGELQHHGTVGQGYVLEQFFATVPLPTFLRIVRANRVEGRLGQNEFTLQPEQLAALHELAGTIPHRSAR